jgi:hypothetical protein
MLPWARALFARIHGILRELAQAAALQDELTVRASPNGDGHGSPRLVHQPPPQSEQSRHEKIEMVNDLLRELMDRGVVIQDVERGLIDFPALRDGEEVLLCYELCDGERIGFWHGLHDGFAGRRPIQDF